MGHWKRACGDKFSMPGMVIGGTWTSL